MCRFLLAATLACLMLCAPVAEAMLGPCDDGMDDSDIGSDLKKVNWPSDKSATWVMPYCTQLLSDSSILNKAFKAKGCKLQSFTIQKLCVQKNGKKEHYRFKAQAKASCSSSPLYIKFRANVSGSRASADTWGRSAS